MKYFILTVLSICCFSNTNAQLYSYNANDFKTIIHSIDTIGLLNPTVYIVSKDQNNYCLVDTTISCKTSDTLRYSVTNLLRKKYTIQKVANSTIPTDSSIKTINTFINNIEKNTTLDKEIIIPTEIYNFDQSTYRYNLINIIAGMYSTKEFRKKQEKEMMPKTIAVGLLSLGMIMITPNDPSYAVLKIILYDKVEHRILYYRSVPTSPVIASEYRLLNDVVMRNFKSLYYK